MPAGPLLTILIFLPAFGAFALLFLRSDDHEWIRRLTLAVSLAEFIFSVWWLLAGVPLGSSGYKLEEFHSWISLGPHHDLAGTYINYHLGVDGISLFLVILTTFLTVVSVLCSWNSIQKRVKEFFIMLLLLEVGVVGVFLSLDLFLFFLFWEVMLIPMYFLIGIWGHERRIYAAVKFVLYTMAGSILMLVGILWLYNVTGTFDLPTIQQAIQNGALTLPTQAETLLFLAFFVAFAIKVPLFPFHTWLPDAHVEAPTAGSVMLAGVLLKMGTYGMIRFCLPLFPNASHRFAPAIAVLAIIGIIYGALVSLVQPNLKKLVAYSSVSHLGFVVLGIFAFHIFSMQGAVFQMLAHGVSTGALFLLVGMLYDRRHTFEISQFGGLSTPMPRLAAFFCFVVLSSLGLPMLNGFVGEFLILLGTYQKHVDWASFAALGVILSACYLLWSYQRVFFGNVTVEKNRALPDISARERTILVTMAVVILWMGIGSVTITSRTQTASQLVLDQSQVPPRAYEVSAPGSTGTFACASRLVAQPTAFSSRAFSRRILAVLPGCLSLGAGFQHLAKPAAAPASSRATAKPISLERLGTR
ncbi:MAG TPA: NADH-quinone oxidoreductase subunit M [Candidatus Methylomirabilis sp.]|nr:NADH-quinone oxidoreductase subunit M [Candidatus Methylomirabilis sp.]